MSLLPPPQPSQDPSITLKLVSLPGRGWELQELVWWWGVVSLIGTPEGRACPPVETALQEQILTENL